MDPLSILFLCGLAAKVGEGLKPLEERFDAIDRYNDAVDELERQGLKLGMRTAVMADNDQHMQQHAARMQAGGYDLTDDQDLGDFAEDMRVQLKLGEFVERLFRQHGCTCRSCGQPIISPEHIPGGKKG